MTAIHTGGSSRSPHWTTGWVAGAGVVAIAAGLLLTLVRQARTIAGQADDITSRLQRTAGNTDSLWQVDSLNATLLRIVSAIKAPATRPAEAAEEAVR